MDMQEFRIDPNEHLRRATRAFFSVPYRLYQHQDPNSLFLNWLKNDRLSFSQYLQLAVSNLDSVLSRDLPQVAQALGLENVTVCVVPRAKAEGHYDARQLLFRDTVQRVVKRLDGFHDGTMYLLRHTDTRTTHLGAGDSGGHLPYVGITKGTCHIDPGIRGKHILLVDDIYTRDVNIDEDAIQAVQDAGALSVAFYAVGKTGAQ